MFTFIITQLGETLLSNGMLKIQPVITRPPTTTRKALIASEIEPRIERRRDWADEFISATKSVFMRE